MFWTNNMQAEQIRNGGNEIAKYLFKTSNTHIHTHTKQKDAISNNILTKKKETSSNTRTTKPSISFITCPSWNTLQIALNRLKNELKKKDWKKNAGFRQQIAK